MLKKYQLSILVSSSFTDEEVRNLIKNFEELVKKFNGQNIHTNEPVKRRLAYPLKKNRNGTYLETIFEAEAEDADKLNRELKITPDILRFVMSLYKEMRPKKIRRFHEETPIAPKPEAVEEKKSAKKVSMEDLDKKIDEILEVDNV